MNIIIKDEFENDYQTRKAPEAITVDFNDIKIASISFLDENLERNISKITIT